MGFVLRTVSFSEEDILSLQHEFTVMLKPDGTYAAMYVLNGRDAPDSETRANLKHELSSLLNAEVDITWLPGDMIADIRMELQRLVQQAEEAGNIISPPSQDE